MMGRGMLQKLFDPLDKVAVAERDALLLKYRTIVQQDLKAETALLESFMAGQRHKHASWIWHFEDRIGGEHLLFDFRRLVDSFATNF